MPILATNLVTNDINLIICACQLRAERANGRPIAEVVRYNAGLAYIVSEPQAGINTSFYNFEIRPAFGQSPSAPGYAVTTGSFPSTFVAELGRA
jgi:hypothetical protein